MMRKIYGGLLLVGGVVLIIVCAILSSRHAAFMATAKPATATINGVGSIRKSGRGAAKLNPDRWGYTFPVHYAIGGHEYDGSASVRGQSQLPVGAVAEQPETWKGLTVPIVYDPAEPTHIEATAHANAASMTWGYVIGVVLARPAVIASPDHAPKAVRTCRLNPGTSIVQTIRPICGGRT